MSRIPIILLALAIFASPLPADNLSVIGSLCVGTDCLEHESYGTDTLRLKENRLRIKFEDTSSLAGFPSNDWQITINEGDLGGADQFSIDDITAGSTPLTIEAGAPSYSLFVNDRGRIGLGTSTPATEMHVISANSPTLRLEQDGTLGWAPQTWDLYANEEGFFVRDITHAARLPFGIQPDAPEHSVFVAENGAVGLGTDEPQAPLHLRRESWPTSMIFENGANGVQWQVGIGIVPAGLARPTDHDDFVIAKRVAGRPPHRPAEVELGINEEGHVYVKGTRVHPDHVFDPDFELMPLAELKRFVERERRLPNIPTAETVAAEGIDVNLFITRLLEKVEELTLYVIEQEERIARLEGKTRAATGDAAR